MKTLIVYGTKHGTTEKCSKFLKDKLSGEVIIINIKKENMPDITTFNNIIIGGSIYMGQIQKEVKNFCIENINVLKEKRVGIFICGLNEKDIEAQLNNAFPKELLTNAVAKECFGGECILKNMNFFERFIMKKVSKIDKDTSKISEENINKFTQLINDNYSSR
ncbi:flavodoxin [Clostridium botulinum]|uniref:flavodoxin domain-containing protein n=1 Tax=Clostridium botulinum TaxID=1491 RepID=UPI0001F84CDF|nr:flavodoxin domain-containing protein [Clostridium botulinum]NFB17231.1 flavodoxin [Clostridium botulinum]NFB67461.1 flavodoxin [Clostridium botulinum]NFB98294.1 flavodoxin [Clostridium botulinum]NFC46498.1 flavodoxin [Clostridium botulinum]NFC59289.1 flavodoxin [Clostridium botulinum]